MSCSRHLIFPMFLLVLLALLAGCAPHRGREKQPCIVVMIRPFFNNYFVEIEKSIMAEAEKERVRIIFLVHDRSDEKGQVELFDKNIASEIDALIIVPEVEELSTKYLIPIIEKANASGKPVIFMSKKLREEKMKEHGVHYDCYIGSDKRKMGIIAAGYLAKKMGGKGKVMVIPGYMSSSTGIDERKDGFLDSMKAYPDMEVLISPPAHWQKVDALFIAKKMFLVHHDIKGVYAMNDWMALGASEAAAYAGIKRPYIIGTDGSKEGIKAIEEGRIDATISQQPDQVGRVAVKSAVKLIRKEKVPHEIYVRNDVITKESMERPFQFDR